MGRVSVLLIEMLRRQLAERGVVVWYDPQQAYSSWVHRLEIPGTSILRLEDGFFRLREKLEPFLEYVTEDGLMRPDADHLPSVLVYVPMAREDGGYALVEAETAGVVMDSVSTRPECNTRLGGLVERVFQQIAPAKATHLARQTDEGLLTIDEVDRLAEETSSAAVGALQVVFGKVSTEEILLEFLSSDAHDQAISDKNALEELVRLVCHELGFEHSAADSPAALRTSVRREVLLGDLLLEIPEREMPDALRRLQLPSKPAQSDFLRHICATWRNRLDLKEYYVEASETVQTVSRLTDVELPLSCLRRTETFPFLERRWLDETAKALAAGSLAEVKETAHVRLPLFWARERPAFQMEWKVVDAAACVCQEAARIEEELRKRKWTLDELVEAYALHAKPWMQLDRVARHLETQYARLEALDSGTGALEKAVAVARHCHADAQQVLASACSAAAADAKLTSRRFALQKNTFDRAVRPLLDKGGKTAFLLVDSLRFEIAAELLEGLGPNYTGQIEPVLGQLPGITAVGMAALLPGAERGLGMEKVAGGIGMVISGHKLLTRQARLSWLQEHAGGQTVTFRLSEVVKLTPKRKKEIEAARLVVVTSQEIDQLGEEVRDEADTRVYMDEVLEKVHRAIRSLAKAGVQAFAISADHGFHLLEVTDPGMAMEPPGGDTVELHPRVWIGHGGASAEGYVRFKASDLGLDGTLEFAFPCGLGVFRLKGGTGAYFHGGLSLQEYVLPLLTIAVESTTVISTGVKIQASMAKPRITNRLFTVTVDAEAEGFFPDAEKRVRLEAISGKAAIGLAVAAAYDFDESTREVRIRPGKPNVVTLMMHATEMPKMVTVQVLDCETQLVLSALKDIRVELGI